MTNKVVLVTGANQGLGHSIIEVAAKSQAGDTYILCSRDLLKGQEAEKKLRDLGVKSETKIDVVELDVDNDAQVVAAAKYVADTYRRLDVLINNAGFVRMPPADDLSATRAQLNAMCNTHIASTAVVTLAFIPLLRKSADPKVINITSGLGSIASVLTKTASGAVFSAPFYGASKVGLNGLTAHLQATELKRASAAAAGGGGEAGGGSAAIRYYAVAPGVLKTAFTGFQVGMPPQMGARPVVELLGDGDWKYPGGTYWTMVEGKMQEVPW